MRAPSQTPADGRASARSDACADVTQSAPARRVERGAAARRAAPDDEHVERRPRCRRAQLLPLLLAARNPLDIKHGLRLRSARHVSRVWSPGDGCSPRCQRVYAMSRSGALRRAQVRGGLASNAHVCAALLGGSQRHTNGTSRPCSASPSHQPDAR
jgi:hypothetical protein